MYGLLGLAVVIALFSIANSMALSIHERTRELGLLRAVGMTRHQTRTAVRWESVLIALLGTGLGRPHRRVLRMVDQRHDPGCRSGHVHDPVDALLVIVVLAVLGGVIATIRPGPPSRHDSTSSTPSPRE